MLEYKKKGKPSKKPSAEELSRLYETKTAKEIAFQLGVSESTVKHWIADYRKEKVGGYANA